MFSLIKYIAILLLLFGGFSVMQANKTDVVDKQYNKAVEILEYVYTNKLNKPTVICQHKNYENNQFVKCYDTDVSFWKVNTTNDTHIVAVNTYAAKVVNKLGTFKELSIDSNKVNDEGYTKALKKLFQ